MSLLNTPHEELCPRCGAPWSSGALNCPQCSALRHADGLKRLSAEAQKLEAAGLVVNAREQWSACLPLLPPSSSQAQWIRAHLAADTSAPPLNDAISASARAEASERHRSELASRWGLLAPLVLVLLKAKTIFLLFFKVKFLGSFLIALWLEACIFGWRAGVGLVLAIFAHELGHFVEIRRRGLPAEAPVFLPGVGAYVRWDAMGVSARTRSLVSLAGPCAGVLYSLVAILAWRQTGDPLFAWVARTSAVLSILNLIPVWQLDGAGALLAIHRTQRVALLLVAVALGVFTRQGMFVFVVAGFLWQLFAPAERRRTPQLGDLCCSVYYALVLVASAAICALPPVTAR